jgi:hypothetical protein
MNHQPIFLQVLNLDLEHLKGDYDIYLTCYLADYSPAIFLMPYGIQDDSHRTVVSRCMAGHQVVPQEHCVFVKDYDENRGILEALIVNGLFEPTGRWINTGLVNFPEVKLLLDDNTWAVFDRRFPRVN